MLLISDLKALLPLALSIVLFHTSKTFRLKTHYQRLFLGVITMPPLLLLTLPLLFGLFLIGIELLSYPLASLALDFLLVAIGSSLSLRPIYLASFLKILLMLRTVPIKGVCHIYNMSVHDIYGIFHQNMAYRVFETLHKEINHFLLSFHLIRRKQ